MAPKISVLMTVHNYQDYVVEAIESVVGQTFRDWELIVVDDGSTDDSWNVVQGYAQHPKIRVRRNAEPLGPAGAYNTCLAMADGELITNLDSDDRFRPALLQSMVSAADAHPEAAVFVCHVQGIDGEGQALQHDLRADWFNRVVDYNAPESWLWQNPVCHNGAVIRRSAHESVGGMSLEHHPAPDWDLWVRFLTKGFEFRLVPEVLVESRVHGAAVTGTSEARLVREYALTSAAHLHPWLVSLSRADLVVENLLGFFSRPEFREGDVAYVADIVERLSSGQGMTAAILARSLQNMANTQQRLSVDKQVLEVDLATARADLDSTRRALEIATDRLDRVNSLPGFRIALEARRAWNRLR